MDRSVWQTAVAATRTTASPWPGFGVACSERAKRRGASRTAARVMTIVSIDECNLLDGEVRDDLGAILVHDQHLFDAHAELVALAVLGLQREDHARLDLQRVIQRPDARDDGRVVLG